MSYEPESNAPAPKQKFSLRGFLTGVAVAALGVYLFRRGGSTVIDQVSSALMIGFGSLTALLAVVTGVFDTPDEGAKKIDRMQKAIYSPVHRRRDVDESTIRAFGLDLSFYQAQEQQLALFGFRSVGDSVDETIEAALPWAKSVLRSFTSVDRQTMAAVYCIRYAGWMWLLTPLLRRPKVVEMESELSDGSFVSTSTAKGASKTSEFPGISRRFLDPRTAVPMLTANHREHLAAVLAAKPGVSVRLIGSKQELFASQDRQQLIKSRHRNSADYDPAVDLALVSGKPLTAEQRKMAEETRRLHRERVAASRVEENSRGN